MVTTELRLQPHYGLCAPCPLPTTTGVLVCSLFLPLLARLLPPYCRPPLALLFSGCKLVIICLLSHTLSWPVTHTHRTTCTQHRSSSAGTYTSVTRTSRHAHRAQRCPLPVPGPRSRTRSHVPTRFSQGPPCICFTLLERSYPPPPGLMGGCLNIHESLPTSLPSKSVFSIQSPKS